MNSAKRGDISLSERLKIDRVRFAEVKASEATTWTFVEVYDGKGTVAVAEISCGREYC